MDVDNHNEKPINEFPSQQIVLLSYELMAYLSNIKHSIRIQTHREDSTQYLIS